MTVGVSKAELMITQQPALAPSPQPRPAPTGRALIVQNVGRRGPFWMPIWGPDRMPIDTAQHDLALAVPVGDRQSLQDHIEPVARLVGERRTDRKPEVV